MCLWTHREIQQRNETTYKGKKTTMNYCNECAKKVSTGKLRCKPCQLIYSQRLKNEKNKNKYPQRLHARITNEQYRFIQQKGIIAEYIRKLLKIAMV